MFKELGSMMSLLGNQGKLQEEMKKFQDSLPTLTAEGIAGGGLVSVKANGRLEIMGVKISQDALALNDTEMLEDLVAAATNQALAKVRELIAVQTAAMAQNMGLPPGMLGGAGGLPGFG